MFVHLIGGNTQDSLEQQKCALVVVDPKSSAPAETRLPDGIVTNDIVIIVFIHLSTKSRTQLNVMAVI